MSPRSAAQNETLREQRRAAILEAGLQQFAHDGFERATVGAIARRAGVSQGLIYHYFAGKDDLLRAVFAHSMAAVDATLVEATAAAPGDRLGRLVRAALGGVRRDLPFWRLTYAVRMQPSVLAALEPDVDAWSGAIRAALATAFRDLGRPAPEIDAAVLFGLIDGVAQHFALDPERYPLDEVIERIVVAFATP
jgi:TetR/AcrR family transcriptional regulator, transcriptional repressor of bet genes